MPNKLAKRALDGAVMVSYLRQLHNRAAFANDAEYLVHTSHITMTVVSNRYNLFIDWFSELNKRYNVSCWASGILNTKLVYVEHLMKIRNLQAWAMGERLQGIKMSLGPEGTIESEPLVGLRGSRRSGSQTGGLRRPVTRS